MRWLSRNLEYLIVALLALAGGAFVIVGTSGDPEAAPPADTRGSSDPAGEPTTTTGSGPTPTCRDARITPESRREGTCRTASSTLTIVNQSSELEVGGLRARVIDAEAIPAETPAGRARDRMRVTVRLRLANRGSEAYTPVGGARDLYLVAGGERVRPDPNAQALPESLALDEEIDSGDSRRGGVRFELAGAATRAIERAGRAQLGVRVAADEVGVVRLRFPGIAGG